MGVATCWHWEMKSAVCQSQLHCRPHLPPRTAIQGAALMCARDHHGSQGCVVWYVPHPVRCWPGTEEEECGASTWAVEEMVRQHGRRRRVQFGPPSPAVGAAGVERDRDCSVSRTAWVGSSALIVYIVRHDEVGGVALAPTPSSLREVDLDHFGLCPDPNVLHLEFLLLHPLLLHSSTISMAAAAMSHSHRRQLHAKRDDSEGMTLTLTLRHRGVVVYMSTTLRSDALGTVVDTISSCKWVVQWVVQGLSSW